MDLTGLTISNSCDIFCAFNVIYFNTKAPHSTKHMGDILNETCSKKCFEFHFLKCHINTSPFAIVVSSSSSPGFLRTFQTWWFSQVKVLHESTIRHYKVCLMVGDDPKHVANEVKVHIDRKTQWDAASHGLVFQEHGKNNYWSKVWTLWQKTW